MDWNSKVELYELIRRDSRDAGLGVRALARKYRVHRRTVRDALASSVPAARRRSERSAPVLGPWKPLVRGWIEHDLDPANRVPVKQRHTARRVWTRLIADYGADVGESTVRAYVARVRSEVVDRLAETMIVADHEPGFEAEVDFGQFEILLAGTATTVYMFAFRLSASGRAVHKAYSTQSQDTFLDGHVHAFEMSGGVPGRIRYDNLSAAVVKVLSGRDRAETDR